MKGVAEMEGNIYGCWGLWPGLFWQPLSVFGWKKGERNRDVFASAAMVMEFTGMLCPLSR